MREHDFLLLADKRPQAKSRLFWFPYAGAQPYGYLSLARQLPREVESVFVQLPGRRGNGAGKARPTMQELSERIAEEIARRAEIPYALFGHSMGGLLAFEVARRLKEEGVSTPSGLLISACMAPHIPRRETCSTDLPDKEFVIWLRKYNGIPEEILDSAELMEMFLPVLRSDIRLAQGYVYHHAPPLGIPIHAFHGDKDESVEREGVACWFSQTTRYFTMHLFPGDHFFIHSHGSEMIRAMGRILA